MREAMQRVSDEQSLPLSRRLATYSALASAAMLASPAADAAVHVWDVNQTIGPAAFFESASFNAQFRIGFASSGTPSSIDDRYFWGPNGNLSFINSSSSTSNNDPARLGNGVVVGPVVPASESGNWYGAISSQNSSHDIQFGWGPGDQGFAGIRFDVNGDYYYGWVDLSMDAGGLVTVNRWALEDAADTPVTTPGAVPEPGTGAMLGLLALGAAGLRRRRQAAVTAA